jgi:hypothetical protein
MHAHDDVFLLFLIVASMGTIGIPTNKIHKKIIYGSKLKARYLKI